MQLTVITSRKGTFGLGGLGMGRVRVIIRFIVIQLFALLELFPMSIQLNINFPQHDEVYQGSSKEKSYNFTLYFEDNLGFSLNQQIYSRNSSER